MSNKLNIKYIKPKEQICKNEYDYAVENLKIKLNNINSQINNGKFFKIDCSFYSSFGGKACDININVDLSYRFSPIENAPALLIKINSDNIEMDNKLFYLILDIFDNLDGFKSIRINHYPKCNFENKKINYIEFAAFMMPKKLLLNNTIHFLNGFLWFRYHLKLNKNSYKYGEDGFIEATTLKEVFKTNKRHLTFNDIIQNELIVYSMGDLKYNK